MIGMILVTIILWLTMGFRNAMLTAVGIPFAFLCSILIMYVLKVSLNTISLSAFVLVTGIMVDDAVIITENIFRHLQMGKKKVNAVIDGTGEVMLPVISSALTTVFAFLPMLIMSGSTGEFFSMIPKTVTFALFASLVEALFILPLHILDWGPKPDQDNVITEDDDPFYHLRKGMFAPFWRMYHGLVEKLLNHKIASLVGVFVLFLVSLVILGLSASGVAPLIKVKFFPGNYFRYHVTVKMPVGTSLETTDTAVRDISTFIMSIGKSQAQSASGTSGYYEDEDYVRHSGHNYGEVIVTLPDEKHRKFPDNPQNDPMMHLEYMRKRLTAYVAKKYEKRQIRPDIRVFEESDGPPSGKAVNIRVTGLSLEDALKTSEVLEQYMRTSQDLIDLRGLGDDRPDMHKTIIFTPKQEAVFEYNLMPAQVTGLIATALNGYKAGSFRTVDEEVDLMVRLARTYDPANISGQGLSDPNEILNIPVIEHSTSPILLRDLVDIKYVQEPHVRTRYKSKPTITITADIKAGSKLSPSRVAYLVNKYYAENQNVFANASLSYGGEFESTNKSFISLGFAFLIAVMLIYMVLASQFNSYIQPVIIISAIPFALIGVVMGLFITRTTFTVTSFMAVVGLAGVAVNDSLLIIEFINLRRQQGRPLRNAVIEACASRMRPVLITTVTTIIGLLPMAIGIPHRSISWSPMATAFTAGLSSATILTLLIIPVEYELFEKIKIRFGRDRDDQLDA